MSPMPMPGSGDEADKKKAAEGTTADLIGDGGADAEDEEEGDYEASGAGWRVGDDTFEDRSGPSRGMS